MRQKSGKALKHLGEPMREACDRSQGRPVFQAPVSVGQTEEEQSQRGVGGGSRGGAHSGLDAAYNE